MKSRERMLKALNHEGPDYLPIDIGGLDVTTIMAGPYRRLCRDLGVKVETPLMVDIMQQCVIVDPAVPKKLGCNTNAKVIYFLPATWREGEAYDGGPIMVPEKFRPVKLPDGTKVIIDAEGNHEIKLPKDGFFYDVTHHPLQHIEKDAEMDGYADTSSSVMGASQLLCAHF